MNQINFSLQAAAAGAAVESVADARLEAPQRVTPSGSDQAALGPERNLRQADPLAGEPISEAGSGAGTAGVSASGPVWVTLECGFCGLKGGAYVLHYQLVRCKCGRYFWALRPARDGRLVLYPHPGVIHL